MKTCFAILLSGFLVSSELGAQPTSGHLLTAEQVTCEELQLARLARRTIIDGRGDFFLWRSSLAGGEFGGLGFDCWQCTETGQGRFEQQLSFDLRFAAGLDRLNPARPLIPQASLTRRDSSSNQVVDELGGWARLTVDLATGVVNPFEPRLPLQVANRVGPQYAHADRPGWGIAAEDLIAPCHGEITALDEKIFLILSRTMRIEEPLGLSGFNSTFFRGEEPLHYRVNIRSYGNSFDEDTGTFFYGSSGPVALELTFSQSDSGQLTTGTARVLPRCTGDLESEPPGCTSQLVPGVKIYFLPPIIPGVETQGQAVLEAAPFLSFPDRFGQDAVTETTIDWAAVLANTGWN
jgi:hypothetical protein